MKDLAPNNRINKTILPIIITIIGCIIFYIILKKHLLFLLLVLSLTIVIGYFIIINAYNKSSNASYDSDFLYFTYKHGTIKIPITNVKSVRFTPSNIKIMGISLHNYTIYYKTDKNILDSYSFMASVVDNNIKEFEKHLNYYSPNTEFDRY